MSDIQKPEECTDTVVRLDGSFSILNVRMETLHRDVTDIKQAMSNLTSAITKLALIEERLSNNSNSLERAFRVLETIEGRVVSLEKQSPSSIRMTKWVEAILTGAVVVLIATLLRHVGIL